MSAGQAGRINAFLRRSHKWGFCKDIVTLNELLNCLLYTSPSPRDRTRSRMPSSA